MNLAQRTRLVAVLLLTAAPLLFATPAGAAPPTADRGAAGALAAGHASEGLPGLLATAVDLWRRVAAAFVPSSPPTTTTTSAVVDDTDPIGLKATGDRDNGPSLDPNGLR